MQIKSQSIELVSVDALIPHPKNMHNHPSEQIERLCKLIEYQGFRTPLTVQRGTNLIVTGHGRLMAAKKLGMEKVPVTYQEFDDDAQIYAHIVADNAIGKDTWATLDLSQINLDIQDLGPELDIDMLGLKDFEVEPLDRLEPQSDEDAVPEVEHPITRRGDVWLLGNHRVMCGDSTMIDDVEKLMNGEKADMVFTDPPYGMKLNADFSSIKTNKDGWKGQGGKYKNVKGDHDDFSDELINTIFYFDYVREMFIWGADYFAQLLPNRNEGSWVVWHKAENENGKGISWTLGSAFELCWSKTKHKRLLYKKLWAGLYGTETQDVRKRIHPTQKPVELTEWFFNQWCEGLNKCVDLYLGSGSTLIACEKTNRKCYGMELDEHYCDVIIKRWEDYTGKKATLESTGQTYEELKDQREPEGIK